MLVQKRIVRCAPCDPALHGVSGMVLVVSGCGISRFYHIEGLKTPPTLYSEFPCSVSLTDLLLTVMPLTFYYLKLRVYLCPVLAAVSFDSVAFPLFKA